MDVETAELMQSMEVKGGVEKQRQLEQKKHAAELRAMQDRLEAAEASAAGEAAIAAAGEAKRAELEKEQAAQEAQLELMAKEVALQQQAGEAESLRLELKRAQDAAEAAQVAARASAEEEMEQMREQLYEEQRKTRVQAEKNHQHQPVAAVVAGEPGTAVGTAVAEGANAGAGRVAGRSWKKHGSGPSAGSTATATSAVETIAGMPVTAAPVAPPPQVPLSSIPIDELPLALKAEALAQRYDPTDVNCWTEDHVAVFLTEVGLGSYAEPFREEAINGECVWSCSRWLAGAAPDFLREFEKRGGSADGGGWRLELQLLTDIVSCWRAMLREQDAAESVTGGDGDDGSERAKQLRGGEQRRLSRLELENYFDVEAWLRMLRMEPATIHAFHAQVPTHPP
jgi:hypothetical protein